MGTKGENTIDVLQAINCDVKSYSVCKSAI